MITNDKTMCPRCGGSLKYYDSVNRIVRTKNRFTKYVKIKRVRCSKCNGIHRVLPEFIFPFKQYETEIIRGVIENIITSETLGFEDYPCEMTMIRWRNAQKIHCVL